MPTAIGAALLSLQKCHGSSGHLHGSECRRVEATGFDCVCLRCIRCELGGVHPCLPDKELVLSITSVAGTAGVLQIEHRKMVGLHAPAKLVVGTNYRERGASGCSFVTSPTSLSD